MKKNYDGQFDPFSVIKKIKKFSSVILILLFVFLYENNYAQDDFSMNKSDTINESKDKKHKVHWSGFVQLHFLEPINTNGDSLLAPDRFRVLRVRLCAKGKINKYASYDLEIDPRAPQITGILRDAFISLHIIPHQEIRIGQQKTVFGYENWESSTHLYTVNRSEVSDNLSRGFNLRDIGIGIIGKIKINEKFRFEDAFQVVNGAGMNVAGPDDFNRKKNFWSRIGLRYKNNDLVINFGISGGIGDLKDQGDTLLSTTDDFIINFKRIGADLEINQKNFFIASEYAFGWETDSLETAQIPGYYFLFAAKTRWHIGPLIRFDALEDQYKRLTFGAYYGEPSAKLRVLLNYEYLGFKSDEFPDGDDDRLYLQLQLRF